MRALFPILPLFLCAAAALQAADVRDGFLPEGARVVELARLPEAPKGTEPACTVRLTPPGVPMALYRGRLFALTERAAAPRADWMPPPDSQPVRDFCWLDGHTVALLRSTALDFVRDGKVAKGIALPSRGMRLARADGEHCYVFGGEADPYGREVLLVGADGSVRNLFRALAPVTAVAGNGTNTFVAVGTAVYFLAPERNPVPVFRERSAIVELAQVPEVGVFYRTVDGVGCIENPESGALFYSGGIEAMDARGGRLLLLTKEREVLLIAPLAGLAGAVRDVHRLARDEPAP